MSAGIEQMEEELHQLRCENNLLKMQVMEQQAMLNKCGWQPKETFILEGTPDCVNGSLRLMWESTHLRLFRVTAGKQVRFALAANGEYAVGQCKPFDPEHIHGFAGRRERSPEVSSVEILQVRVQGYGDRFF